MKRTLIREQSLISVFNRSTLQGCYFFFISLHRNYLLRNLSFSFVGRYVEVMMLLSSSGQYNRQQIPPRDDTYKNTIHDDLRPVG